MTVADDRVVIRRGSDERRFDRQPVRAVFVDGRQLVLLGAATEELVREKTDQPPRRIRDAFVAHGYPWHEGDPHGDKGDAAKLRIELARLGLVVRDEMKRQFWRVGSH